MFRVALVLLLIDFGASLVQGLAHTGLTNRNVWIQFGAELVIESLLFWLIFLGKNWARWLLLTGFVAGLCATMPHLIRHFEQFSASAIATYCVGTVMDVAIFVALFHRSTNEWFLHEGSVRRERRRKKADVESHIRKEYEQRLSQIDDHWQRVDIEAQIAERVKKRMKWIYDAESV